LFPREIEKNSTKLHSVVITVFWKGSFLFCIAKHQIYFGGRRDEKPQLIALPVDSSISLKQT
jgi:hypothetical protein